MKTKCQKGIYITVVNYLCLFEEILQVLVASLKNVTRKTFVRVECMCHPIEV